MKTEINQIPREIWLKNTLEKIPAGVRILDAGAGELRYKNLCSHLNYVAQDFGSYNGQGDGSGFQTGSWDQSRLDLVCDIVKIPEPDKSFDAIMCIEVFEHLPDPISAIKEFSRLLKSGGNLIITAPFMSATHFAPYHFYSGFNRYFFEKYLADFGFNILEIKPNGSFFQFLWQETRRIPQITEKYLGRQNSWLEKITVKFMLLILGKMAEQDKNSQEIINFGYHVLAQKK
jgi:ubiquinone/menaquinone biosynthesis C-methylase UbiE